MIIDTGSAEDKPIHQKELQEGMELRDGARDGPVEGSTDGRLYWWYMEKLTYGHIAINGHCCQGVTVTKSQEEIYLC